MLSNRQYDDHFELYKNYVNKVIQLLKAPASTREWSRDFNYAYAGARLHEMYFEHIDGSPTSNAKMLDVITEVFGSFNKWAKSMMDLAKTCRPAGWVLTCYNSYNGSICNIAFDAHDQMIPDMIPLVVMDMYEHSYLLDFDLDKDKYVKDFIQHLDWNLVWTRLQSAQSS